MRRLEKHEMYFVLEFELSMIRNISGPMFWSSEDSCCQRKAYLYGSNTKQVQLGTDISKALRFSAADLAIIYLDRNDVVRSIRSLARLERRVHVSFSRLRRSRVA